MKKLAFVCLGLLCLIGSLDAGGCYSRPTYQVPPTYYAPPVYVAPTVIVTELVPIAVPSYQIAANSTRDQDVAFLKLELENQRLKFELYVRSVQPQPVLATGQPAPQLPQQSPKAQEVSKSPSEHPALAVFRQSCYNCHSKAKTDGGLDLTVKLTDRQLRNVATKSYTGHMPKNGKLTDQQIGEVIDWVDKQE